MKLLEKGIEYILTNNIISKYVFKITPRYKLTDRFNLDNYKTDKYCFQTSFDVAIKEIVYITKLYSIPFNKLNKKRFLGSAFCNELTGTFGSLTACVISK